MTNGQPCSRDQLIKPAADGILWILGDASASENGAWMIHLVPDQLWVGSVVVLGRARARGADQDGVAFVPIPYRQISAGNAALDYSFAAAPLTANTMVLVPAPGISVGVLVSCSAGTAKLYNHAVIGASAP